MHIPPMPRPLLVRSAALLLSVLPTACAVAPPLRSRNPASTPQAPAVIVEQSHGFGSIPPTAPPAIAAESSIVIDADSGRVLYSKNADSPRQVASTQKIITALCVLDAGNMDKQVVIEKIDVACEPTRLDMKPGESYSRRDLLKALMVKSCNDVARALARDVGGSVDGFADLMNRKAASLGMRNSHFVNPNGLPSTAQYSTARDMAIAARYAYRSPLLRSYVATKAFEFQFADGHTKLLENTNRILKSVPYCNGMKTGTTDAAGRCLVCTGSLNGRSTIVVVLKSTTPFIWKDSEKLLRWSLER